jgi:putative heme-binding domain-containing protein
LLSALRVLELVCIRLGAPDEACARRLERRLGKLFPHANEEVDRELANLLVFLGDARVLEPALARVESATKQEDRIAYLWALRTLKTGWTLEQRGRFFAALNELVSTTSGGNSYAKYLENLRDDARETLSEAERAALGPRVDPPAPKAAEPVEPRPFVKAWTLEELVRIAPRSHAGRDFERGREVFREARCVECHRFAGAGGGSGPDLTGVGARFGDADIAEAAADPSKTISDLYRDFEVITQDDQIHVGRLEELAGGAVRVWLADGQRPIVLEAAEIAERRPSPLSRMPNALLDTFEESDVLDLFAYLRSGGKSDDPAFAKQR